MRVLKHLCLGAAALAIGMGSALAADKPTLKIGYVNGWTTASPSPMSPVKSCKANSATASS